MAEKAETALKRAHTHSSSLARELTRLDRELSRLRRRLERVRKKLDAVGGRVEEIVADMRTRRREINELRQKVKKHYKLLRELDPEREPAERRRVAQALTRLRERLARATEELEGLEARYDEALAEEARLIGEEAELEQEIDALKARYERLLKQTLRLSQALERRVRDIQARHY